MTDELLIDAEARAAMSEAMREIAVAEMAKAESDKNSVVKELAACRDECKALEGQLVDIRIQLATETARHESSKEAWNRTEATFLTMISQLRDMMQVEEKESVKFDFEVIRGTDGMLRGIRER